MLPPAHTHILHIMFTILYSSVLAVQSSDSTVKAVSATLATVIAIFLIVIVAAVAARALIMRKKEVILYRL